MTSPLVVKFTKPSPTSLTMEVLRQDTNLIPRGDFTRTFGMVPVLIHSRDYPVLSSGNSGTPYMWVRGTDARRDNRVGVANFDTQADRDAALAAFVAAIDELNVAAITELNNTPIPVPPPTDDNIVIVGTL